MWDVLTTEDAVELGEVRWHTPWRRYAFFAEVGTIFEQDCLRRIATFVEQQTQRRRADRELERESSP